MTNRIGIFFISLLLSVQAVVAQYNERPMEFDDIVVRINNLNLNVPQESFEYRWRELMTLIETTPGTDMLVNCRMANLAYKKCLFYQWNQADSVYKYSKLARKFAMLCSDYDLYFNAWYCYIEKSFYDNKLNIVTQQAHEMYLEARKMDYEFGVALAQAELGLLYYTQQVYDKATDNFLSAIPVLKKHHLWLQYTDVIGNCMLCLMMQNRKNIAQHLFWQIDSLANSSMDNAFNPLSIGDVMVHKSTNACTVFGNPEDAETLHGFLLQVRYLSNTYLKSQSINPIHLYSIERTYARITGDTKRSLQFADSVYQYHASKEGTYYLVYSTRELAEAHEKVGNYDKACEYYKKYISLKDSVVIKEKVDNFAKQVAEANIQEYSNEAEALNEMLTKQKSTSFKIIVFLVLIIFVLLLMEIVHIKQKSRRLRQIVDMKSSFIQHVTHEINTPLNIIMGFSDVLQEMAQNEEQLELSKSVVRNCKRINKMVMDTLYLSDADYGSILNIETEECNLADCILTMKQRVEYDTQVESIPFTGVTTLTYNCHRASLEVLLYNLIHNAVEHGERPIGIVLSGETNKLGETNIEIRIRNAGKGIPEGMEDKIFERFVKCDEFDNGLGVGLSVAGIAARRIGATLALNKNYKQGVEMVLTINYVS